MAKKQNQTTLTLSQVTALYRGTGTVGCYADGTLKIGGVKIKGWILAERRADGTLVTEGPDGAGYEISLRG